jgi:hypothetical protein
VKSKWLQFWFSPAPAERLGAARAVFFGGLFFLSFFRDFRGWAGVSNAFWMPTVLFHRLRLPILSSGEIGILQDVWRASLGLSAIGLLTRVSVPVSLVSATYLLGLPNNFGRIEHEDALVVLAMLVLAFSRCGDGVSVDRLLRRVKTPSASEEYRWPSVLICVLLACVFLGAGVSKLRKGGFAWFATDHLAFVLLEHQYPVSTAMPLTRWGVEIAHHRLLTRLLAFGVLTLECGYPLALFSVRARRVIVPSAILMIVGFRVLMGPDFSPLIFCHAFWIPWLWNNEQNT